MIGTVNMIINRAKMAMGNGSKRDCYIRIPFFDRIIISFFGPRLSPNLLDLY